MALERKRLTKSELAKLFEVYQAAFPDWQREHDVVLARTDGVVTQRISIEALRYGAYRPSCSVEVTVANGLHILHRFLDIKHGQVRPRQHDAKWPTVLRAMEEEFQPPVRKPLDAREVLRLGEEEVERNRITNVNNYYALAALNAYLGDTDRALLWCRRIDEQLGSRYAELASWERQISERARKLRDAIAAGRHREFLNAARGAS